MKVPLLFTLISSHNNPENTCHNNSEKLSTTKINKHIPSGYSLFTHCSFDTTRISLIIIEVKIA